jgi:hypothetical protein
VEVREQVVDAPELEPRRDEELGAPGERRAAASVSSTRTVVVPTARTRGAARIAAQASGRTA